MTGGVVVQGGEGAPSDSRRLRRDAVSTTRHFEDHDEVSDTSRGFAAGGEALLKQPGFFEVRAGDRTATSFQARWSKPGNWLARAPVGWTPRPRRTWPMGVRGRPSRRASRITPGARDGGVVKSSS